jgi:hypothetical protein
MEEFNFQITLEYRLECFQINPPVSFKALLDKIKEKFNLAHVNTIFYIDEDDELEVKLGSEADYFSMFDYVEDKELPFIKIIIKSDDHKTKRKKSFSKSSWDVGPHPISTNVSISGAYLANGNF